MSLNGLHHAVINEAYGASAAEPGGWFLLKYLSRDEVELLSQGSGGVSEIRDVVAQFTEPSPLYGFIRYRRRSVLIKYVPPSTSRLLQARLAVHFQSIIDRFSPHDTVFTISSSEELKDSALSAACSLHAASGSTSSSTSSAHRRKLGEIAEDEEEGSTIRAKSESATPTETLLEPVKAQESCTTTSVVGKRTTVVRYQKTLDSPNASEESQTPTDRPATAAASSISTSDFNTKFGSDAISNAFQTDEDIRFSTSSARPSIGALYDTYPYTNKPKVKVGPRPSLDPGKRPHTSSSAAPFNDRRPVSTLPPGIRLASRKPPPVHEKSKGQKPNTISQVALPPPLPLPISINPSQKPTALPSRLATSTQNLRPKSNMMTPEKQRLLKAMQLRKKQLSGLTHAEGPAESDLLSTPLTTLVPGQLSKVGRDSNKAIEGTLAKLNGAIKLEVAVNDEINDTERVDTSTHKSTSSPISGVESFEILSTKASSISEPANDSTELQSNVAAQGQVYERDDSLTKENDPDVITDPKVEESYEQPLDSSSYLKETVALDSEIVRGNNQISLDSKADQPESNKSPISKGTADTALATFSQRTSALIANAIDNDESLCHSEPPSKDEKSAAAVEAAPADKLAKKPTLIDPIRTDLNSEKQGESVTTPSNDSLMDDLDSASLHDALPVTVIKSPITPSFSKDESSPDLSPTSTRSASDSTRGNTEDLSSNRFSALTEMPVIEIARSVSASNLSTARAQQSPVAIAKKVNVSSGISQRIKALEMRSASAGSANPSPNGSPSFPNTRSTNLNIPSRAASGTGRQSPVSLRSPMPSPSNAPEDLRLPKRPAMALRTKASQEKPKSSKMGGSSVSVTARIIREPPSISELDPKRDLPSELFQSSITVEHGTPRKPSVELRASLDKVAPTINPEVSQSSSPLAGSSRRSSSSRRRSDTASPTARASPSINGMAEEKQESRRGSTASRFLRRMSSISTQSRKSIANAISPTLKETEMTLPPLSPDSQMQNTESVLSGIEVNVQFPDNLLWKRRCLNLDDSGNMTLDPSRADEYTKISTRRFRLSEFSSPFAPDQDQQELPFSVVLDHLDGGTLQCACENADGQTKLLNALRRAHHSITA
ncbi:MAG: hypothetical protein M1814_003086 [Vezdaea aestivalis]|nr:MAG: hypothetical protein M1814_003086 [Vezdaea aestivalis]